MPPKKPKATKVSKEENKCARPSFEYVREFVDASVGPNCPFVADDPEIEAVEMVKDTFTEDLICPICCISLAERTPDVSGDFCESYHNSSVWPLIL